MPRPQPPCPLRNYWQRGTIDNDKQGNASRIFGAYEREQEAGACRIIKTGRIAGNIRDTEVENMDIVACNYFMELA